MCGIAGFVDRGCKTTPDQLQALACRMAEPLVHRGPDALGHWINESAGVVLTHTRLSVIDLSPAGHQPMVSACGRYVVVYNGEIYNFEQLRADLERVGCATSWRGHSDTEVLLQGIASWGLEETLQRANGMFALAIWDREEQRLSLARDRLGEKPLYYGWVGRNFAFASELKALGGIPGWAGAVDPQALELFFKYAYVPAPFSIFRGVYKVLPGTIIEVRPHADVPISDKPLGSREYWSIDRVIERTASGRTGTASDEELVSGLDSVLRSAVKARMVADVPLGAFLSGGVDSSTVVALMQAQSPRAIRTFSIGFTSDEYDEAAGAREVAAHLGTDHTELYVTPEAAMAVIPSLPEIYDEPFADSSQIPTFILASLARREVTVTLSGDGADELLGGYNRYLWASRYWKLLEPVPLWLRTSLHHVMSTLPPGGWATLLAHLGRFSADFRHRNAGEKMMKLISVLPARTADEAHDRLATHWTELRGMPQGRSQLHGAIPGLSSGIEFAGAAERMMYRDLLSYFPDDILVKVDRATMAVSLEARIPYADPAVVEFAWGVPLQAKIRNAETKWLLRRVLAQYVPRPLTDRPKMGFAVPLAEWLRGPLRDWSESLLEERRIEQQGIIAARRVRSAWAAFLDGGDHLAHPLWVMLMFQAWVERQ